jgi:hypothetical protein
MRRFRDTAQDDRSAHDHVFAPTLNLVTLMSRRNAPGPSFEIVPRDRLLRRTDARAGHALAEAQQLGPRLRKLYSPSTAEHPEDMRMLIVTIDGKLQKQ